MAPDGYRDRLKGVSDAVSQLSAMVVRDADADRVKAIVDAMVRDLPDACTEADGIMAVAEVVYRLADTLASGAREAAPYVVATLVVQTQRSVAERDMRAAAEALPN
jgi:hypothetical protein